jgi:hypothetical protein
VYSALGERIAIGASITIVLIAGAVVAWRDATDPFVRLRDKESRLRVAATALWEGRCDDARVAAERARRLDPRARETEEVIREIGRRCGR